MDIRNLKKLQKIHSQLENICATLENISDDEKETDPAAAEQILMYKDYIQTQTEELNEFIEEP
ncbi:hypothetical protein [Lacihabitans soyangensis]|uniref:Uncharacterized protein n=1 Tax=Lacihabitans soyangensis TaxID=869394 RepID=A0AAE3H4A9_9BACT|nr:hypothetical protein [Lacihabitans soyangensis]MCP9762660.1 hypothetical protein [Lacihabitans soyangensis]